MVILIVVSLLGIPALAQGAQGDITLAAYLNRLTIAEARATAGSSAPSPAAMRAVRQALGLPVNVEAQGVVVRIGPDPFLAALTGSTSHDFLRAGDHLSALEDATRAALAAQPPNRSVATALAHAYRGIYARPSTFEHLRHDLWLLILTAWHAVVRLLHRAPVPPWMIVVCALAILGLIAAMVFRRMASLVPERSVKGGQKGIRSSKPPDWDRIAREALARGDFAGAVRARYSALLATLALRGVIPPAPSITAGECRSAVASGLPGAYPAVALATTIFEATVFGHSAVTEADVDKLSGAEMLVKAS